MSLGKRLIKVGLPACLTDTTDIFGDSSGVALYSLDYDASDESGTYDGTPTDVDFGVGGQINYGARFNGSSSKIDTGFAQNTSNAFTWSLWFKADASQSSNAMIMDTTSTTSPFPGVGIGLSSATDLRAYQAGSASRFTHTNNTITSDTWVHVAYTHDGSGNFNFYINNQLSASGNYTSNLNSSQNILLGDSAVSSWNNFNGDIDQVRIFSKALSSDEVSTLYAETACVYTCTTDTVDFPTTNLAYYKLDNSAEDETGSYDGTPTDINYTFGRFGQAAVFNGSSSKIDTGISSISSPFAVSMWINEDVLGSGVFFGNWNSTAADMYWQTTSDGRLRISIDGYSVDFFGTAGDVQINTWHHIAVTLSGGVYEVYLDNVSLGTSTTSVTTFSSGQNFMIGNSSKPSTPIPFNGKIDQVRIFSSALDSTQVESLYNEKPCEDTSNFKTVLYEGTSANQYISQVGFDLDVDNGGDGGLVWIKGRTNSVTNHRLFDTVRGASAGSLASNLTNAEMTASGGVITSFDANGFTIPNQQGDVNGYPRDYVAWVWKAGGDAVTDSTTGDLTADISANTEFGFSIVNFTGVTATPDGVTVPHGLNSAPELVILKPISVTGDWQVYAYPIGNNKRLKLNDTSIATTTTGWDNTHPDSNNVTMEWSSISKEYIMYCFHSVSGYSKIGSYIGAGSGTRVYTTSDGTSTGTGGFKPSWVMLKNASVGGAFYDWYIFDVRRDDGDGDDNIESYLVANTSAAEVTSNTGSNGIVMEDDGFTLDIAASSINGSGNTFVYMAFK